MLNYWLPIWPSGRPPLRVPESLFTYARKVAAEEHVSMKQFFFMAIAEKVSALKTEAYFCGWHYRGNTDEW